jgi:hypothetical protein
MLFEQQPITATAFEDQVIALFGFDHLVMSKTSEDPRTFPGDKRIPLRLYYVKTSTGNEHVATWNGKTRRGWVFDTADGILDSISTLV